MQQQSPETFSLLQQAYQGAQQSIRFPPPLELSMTLEDEKTKMMLKHLQRDSQDSFNDF
jgi:hypothetical protein